MAARGSEQQAAEGWPSGSPEGEKRLSWKLKGFRRGTACFSLQAANQPPWAAAGCSRLLSALLWPPHPQQCPRDTGRKGIAVTSILHSAPRQGTLQAQSIRPSHTEKNQRVWLKQSTACLSHRVCTLEEVRGRLPARRDAPCRPPWWHPGVRGPGVAHFLHISLRGRWHQEGTCPPGWAPCRLAGARAPHRCAADWAATPCPVSPRELSTVQGFLILFLCG